MKLTLLDIDRTCFDVDRFYVEVLVPRSEQALGTELSGKFWEIYERKRNGNGGLVDEIIPYAVRELGLSDDSSIRSIFYGKDQPLPFGDYLFEGTKQAIDRLKAEGHEVCLYSNGSVIGDGNFGELGGYQPEKIRGLGLGVSRILCGEDKVALLGKHPELIEGVSEIHCFDDNGNILTQTEAKLKEMGFEGKIHQHQINYKEGSGFPETVAGLMAKRSIEGGGSSLA